MKVIIFKIRDTALFHAVFFNKAVGFFDLVVIDGDIDTADRVNHICHLVKIDGCILGDIEIEGFVQGADSLLGACGISLIDFALAAVDFDEGVAHDAGQLELAAGIVNGQDHNGIRACNFLTGAGVNAEQRNIGDAFCAVAACAQVGAVERIIVIILQRRVQPVGIKPADGNCRKHHGHQQPAPQNSGKSPE